MTTGFVLSRLIVVFVAMAAGFIAVKSHVLDQKTGTVLSRVIVYIFNPCMMLSSALTSERIFSNEDIYAFTGIAAACYAFLIATSFAVSKLLRVRKDQDGLYRFMYIFSNIGFFGLPVISSLYGPQATFLVAIFNIPFQLLTFTYGITLVSGGRRKLQFKMFLHPMILSSLLAYALYLLRIDLPQPAIDAVAFLGQAGSPAAMLVVGIILAGAPLKKVFANPRLYGLILVKMVLVPALVLLVLRRIFPAGENVELIISVAVTVMAMPIAANTAILSTQYGGDAESAACGVFLGTISSAATIPLLIWLIQTI